MGNIKWRSKPTYKPRIGILEALGIPDSGALIGIMPLVIIGALIYCGKLLDKGMVIQSQSIIFLLFLLVVVPEIHKNYRRRNTSYELDDEFLFIKSVWYGKPEELKIPIINILKFYIVNFKDDCGHIYIFLKDENQKIITRNFWGGGKSPRNCMFFIQNASKNFEVLNDLLKSHHNKRMS